MDFLKKLLYQIVGRKQYLRIQHKLMMSSFRLGLLKKNYWYDYHYFVHNLIKKGDTVLDIGANLGYYTRLFSDFVGDNGKVIAIEPVLPYFETAKWSVSNRKNVIVHNYALGLEEKKIQMSLPTHLGFFRSGLTQVSDISEHKNRNDLMCFDAEMKMASKLFADLEKIDYIKIDIEGYEEYVIPEMINLIAKHRPLIQIETWGTHRAKTFQALLPLAYSPYILNDGKKLEATPIDKEAGIDYIFFPNERIDDFKHLMK